MKITADEIRSYLARYKPIDEVNRRAIEHICLELGYSIHFDIHDQVLSGLSFLKFKSWLVGDLFHSGDILVDLVTQDILIVKKSSPDFIVAEAVLTSDDKLTLNPKKIPYNKNYKGPSLEELIRFQQAILKQSLCWNGKYKKLVPYTGLPKKNASVRITIVGRRVGIGVFKEIDDCGNIVMYCVKMDQENTIRYSLHEIVGPRDHFQLDIIFPKEREELSAELSYKNLCWNGRYKRIEPQYYANILKHYFYMDHFFRIRRVKDENSAIDRKRKGRTNYFKLSTEVEEVLALLSDFLKDSTSKRVASGDSYYYIDHYFYVMKYEERNSESDIRRFSCKNYFNCTKKAEDVISLILAKRQEQFLKI